MIETPRDDAELVALTAEAVANRTPLAIEGGGTKTAFGPAVEADRTVSLAGLRGISLYEPEELVLSAKAGTPLADIEAALGDHHQKLAFDPPNWCTLWGSDPAAQTIGGIVSCGLSGPARVSAGAARDFVLGCHWVNGRAELMRSGGRVMKNVTGYDLPKLMTGAFGTLGILTDVTLKVLPAPAFEATLDVAVDDAGDALAVMTAALQSPQAMAAAGYDPARQSVYLRLEGPDVSVEDRLTNLRKLRDGTVIEAQASTRLWAAHRDLEALTDEPVIWLLSIAPTSMPDLMAAFPAARALVDWGGGRVALAGDVDPASLFSYLAEQGGHARLLRAPQALRRDTPFAGPLSRAEAVLSARLRDSFDPLGLFNPGRLSFAEMA